MVEHYLLQILGIALVATPIFLVVRILWYLLYLKKKKIDVNLWHELGFWFLVVFAAALASFTISTQWEFYTTELAFRGNVNLIPFVGIWELLDGSEFGIVNVFGNILMFLPLGLLIPLLWERKKPLKTSVISAFAVSFLIEFMQLFSWRSTDIDDLILNTLGGLLGGLLYLLAKRWLPNFVNRFKIKGKVLEAEQESSVAE